jgi:hypothetical protein
VVTDTLADLRKVVAMRGNGFGGAMVGGVNLPGRAGTAPRTADGARTDTAPFTIPERFKDALARFDQDGDGKLSGKEIDAMPDGLARRIRQAIRLREPAVHEKTDPGQ